MARNKFDVDETLETPFNIKHLLRAGVYIEPPQEKDDFVLGIFRDFRGLFFGGTHADPAGHQCVCAQ